MATLPSDIIYEILSRMPVKSLVRFRRVSKLWCEYIDSPYFATIHSKRAVEEEPTLVMLRATHDWCYPNQPRICDKFNSLVVINPLRKECFELPPMDKKPDWRLSYEESCGLGFDDSTNTFKMVCVFPRIQIDVGEENLDLVRKNLCTMVHVLGTNLWQEAMVVDDLYEILHSAVENDDTLRDYPQRESLVHDFTTGLITKENLNQKLAEHWGKR
ncbi:F-box domain-containing protein [Artemisia annua]|uniref:F-box domain-containing protein n=1 Tax=Artemisia annua TaxID=35608 RepID=A0A2U1KL59_ARTAN|nr:F-box domain-containing protein [Artemisia annua]